MLSYFGVRLDLVNVWRQLCKQTINQLVYFVHLHKGTLIILTLLQYNTRIWII